MQLEQHFEVSEKFDIIVSNTLANDMGFSPVRVLDECSACDGDAMMLNGIWDPVEYYYDYGQDWCPDSLETGEGHCVVVDKDEDNYTLYNNSLKCLQKVAKVVVDRLYVSIKLE